jgi:hypothetical protein
LILDSLSLRTFLSFGAHYDIGLTLCEDGV